VVPGLSHCFVFSQIHKLRCLHVTSSIPGYLHVVPSGMAGAITILIGPRATVSVAVCQDHQAIVVGLKRPGASAGDAGGALLQPFCSGEATINFPGTESQEAAAGLLALVCPPSSGPWGVEPRGDPPWRCFGVKSPEPSGQDVQTTSPLRAIARTIQSFADGVSILGRLPVPACHAYITSPSELARRLGITSPTVLRMVSSLASEAAKVLAAGAATTLDHAHQLAVAPAVFRQSMD
jgi:hypothetical protein